MTIPDTINKTFCPSCGETTKTFHGRRVTALGAPPELEREWCVCGNAVTRVTYVRETKLKELL